MKIFVINLKNRDDRRKHIVELFNKHNISDYSFIEAVNGNNLDNNIINQCRSKLQKSIYREGEFGLNEIGCALSHLKIYKEILSKNLHGAFIFEDDICFIENVNIHNISEDVLEFNENNPFILRLGGIVNAIKYKEYSINNRIIFSAQNKFLDAHAYYINNKAAKNILICLGDYPFFGIDMYKQLKPAVKVYQYKKQICIQDKNGFISDIDGERSLRYSSVGINSELIKFYFKLRAVLVKKIFLPAYFRYKIKRK